MSTPERRSAQSKSRKLRLLLRDGGALEGGVYLTEGHALSPYLGSRKGGWMNVVDAVWADEGEVHHHAVIQCDDVLIAMSIEADVTITFAGAGGTPRDVDIALNDGTRVRGRLLLAARQRLSDYLASCGKFIPVFDAMRVPGEQSLGDIALNSASVRAVRDARVFTAAAPTRAEATAEWGGVRRGSKAVEPDGTTLTPAQRERETRLERHWLVQLAAAADLAPPDPRSTHDAASLQTVWTGIAQRNDVTDIELATLVVAAFDLPLADLDGVTDEALRIVPERIARKLGVIPVRVDERFLHVAVSDPGSLEIEKQLGFVTRLELRFEIAPPEDIRGAMDWHYGVSGELAGARA